MQQSRQEEKKNFAVQQKRKGVGPTISQNNKNEKKARSRHSEA